MQEHTDLEKMYVCANCVEVFKSHIMQSEEVIMKTIKLEDKEYYVLCDLLEAIMKNTMKCKGEGYDGKFIYLVSQKTFNVLDKIHSSVMTARFKTIEA